MADDITEAGWQLLLYSTDPKVRLTATFDYAYCYEAIAASTSDTDCEHMFAALIWSHLFHYLSIRRAYL
eukprot:3173-Heterococcus_DN1.PRE.3